MLVNGTDCRAVGLWGSFIGHGLGLTCGHAVKLAKDAQRGSWGVSATNGERRQRMKGDLLMTGLMLVATGLLVGGCNTALPTPIPTLSPRGLAAGEATAITIRHWVIGSTSSLLIFSRDSWTMSPRSYATSSAL